MERGQRVAGVTDVFICLSLLKFRNEPHPVSALPSVEEHNSWICYGLTESRAWRGLPRSHRPLGPSSASETDRTLISILPTLKLWPRPVQRLAQSRGAALCRGLDSPSGLHRFQAHPAYNSPGLSGKRHLP